MKARTAAVFLSLSLSGCDGPKLGEILFGPTRSTRERPPAPPSSTPDPAPTPSAPPEEPPAPDPSPGNGEDIPNNTAAVASVTARLYFVECAGVPDFTQVAEAPVGCRLHMDCTARDQYRRPTRAVGPPRWFLSDPSLVSGGQLSDYTPVFEVRRPGELVLHVMIDGVRSNDVAVRLY